MAKPLKIQTPEILAAEWDKFKDYCDHGHVEYAASAGKVLSIPKRIIYTLERFQVWLGISRDTWMKYRNRARYADTIKGIEAEVFARKKEAMVNAEGSTTGLIFDMKANYGINDKTIIDASIEGGIEVTLNLGGPEAKSGS